MMRARGRWVVDNWGQCAAHRASRKELFWEVLLELWCPSSLPVQLRNLPGSSAT